MDGRLFNKMKAIERLFPKNFSSNYSDQIMAFCFHIPTKIGKNMIFWHKIVIFSHEICLRLNNFNKTITGFKWLWPGEIK